MSYTHIDAVAAGADRMHDEEAEAAGQDTDTTYHLERDGDGHWYVIQDEDTEEFHTWVEDMEAGRDSEHDFSDFRIQGPPSSVHFYYYWEA